MRRRGLITGVAATAATWPLGARAQQKAMPVIGVLGATTAAVYASRVVAFREGLGETGYVEGQNVMIEYRWAEGHYDQLPVLAADLVGRKVDVIAAFTPPLALAAKAATSTIPIVFSVGIDPVAAGLVASIARPGGNLTGVSILFTELAPTLLELLSELVPEARVIALLVNPNSPEAEPTIRGAQQAGRAKGMQLDILKAATGGEIDAAFVTLVQMKGNALVIGADGFFSSRSGQLVALAARYAIPTIYFRREFAAAGGLISYAPSLTGSYRQIGIYVGRIMKGAKPADLPVQQPVKFELVINLKTATALGLTVPQALLARADEVIE
jgi:putative ABC transport system substrate-binding protein